MLICSPANVRIRILKHTEGIIEGVSLAHLVPGLVYDVPVSLGTWLASQGAAEEDVTPTAAIVVPRDQESALLTGGVSISQPEERADDRSRRSRHKRR